MQRFFWTNLERCKRLCPTIETSKALRHPGHLSSSISTFGSAEDSRKKSVDVLVITDHFTRVAQTFPCKDKTAKQVARVLWDWYFCVFGLPENSTVTRLPTLRVSSLVSRHLTGHFITQRETGVWKDSIEPWVAWFVHCLQKRKLTGRGVYRLWHLCTTARHMRQQVTPPFTSCSAGSPFACWCHLSHCPPWFYCNFLWQVCCTCNVCCVTLARFLG